MELQDYKSHRARDMASQAGLANHVDFKVGDAVQMISGLPRASTSCSSISGRTSMSSA
jgi:hypothetical protein